MQVTAERNLASLKEQLTGMANVHSQLEEAMKELQGRVELKDQEMEVLNMELQAKDKVIALQQAITDQMALQLPLPQVSLCTCPNSRHDMTDKQHLSHLQWCHIFVTAAKIACMIYD